MKVGISGHSHLVRDTNSMAVINKDSSGRKMLLAHRQAAKIKDQEIAYLKDQVEQLWNIVTRLSKSEK